MSLSKKAILTIIVILFIDQFVKIIVKTNMTIEDSIPVFGNWFQIHFTENPGFAFGMKFGGNAGKIFLTVFRIFAVCAIAWYLSKIIKEKQPTALVLGIAALLAGASGNIIDSVFYGQIFNESTYTTVASIFPAEGGYAPLLQGRVVDMFYFPIINGTFPTWLPFWGGEEFIFFRPIFNVADASITCSIIYLLLFQRKNLARILK